jgi:nucleotide-binding universal stress UspA family protein
MSLKYNNVLIPTDGKKSSEHVIEFICAAQNIINAKINVVYVIEVPRNMPLHAEIHEKVNLANIALNNAKKIAERYNANINTSTIYARTIADSVLSTAENLKCDLIALAQDSKKLRIFANKASSIYQRSKCSVWLFNNKPQNRK